MCRKSQPEGASRCGWLRTVRMGISSISMSTSDGHLMVGPQSMVSEQELCCNQPSHFVKNNIVSSAITFSLPLPSLMSYFRHGFYACGTVRCDRQDFPRDLRGLKLQRGCHEFWQRGILSAWQDKRQVNILSTLTSPDETVQIERKEKDGSQTTLNCPTAINVYNHHMAGVDKGDQMRVEIPPAGERAYGTIGFV